MAISQLYPNQRPTLNLNFARSKALDPRITFTRNSTATYVGSNGLIQTAAAHEARFDHDGNGNCRGLLIEESRTNSIANSVVFSSGYGVSNFAATDNVAVAPDGTTTAASLMETSSSGFHNFFRAEITTGAAANYAQSIFVKNNGRAYVNLRWLSLSVSNCWHTVTFALIGDGSITQEQSGSGANFTNISRSIEHIGNGWYRITLGATNPNARIYPWILDGSDGPTPTLNSLYGVVSYTGDVTKGYYIWGAQVETGTFATSYIPTSGSTVTRSADVASMTGTNFSSWYNQSEGTLFVKSINHGGSRAPFALALNTQNFPMVELGENSSSTNAYVLRVFDTVGAQADITATVNAFGTSNSYAGAIKTNDFAVSVNGNTPLTDTSGNLVTTFNTLRIGRQWNSNTFTGTISRFAYYPTRLSDSQLEELTS